MSAGNVIPIRQDGPHLQEQEHLVEQSLVAYVDVGNALKRIRDEGLYREEGFTSFGAFLKAQAWGIDTRKANQLIGAAQAAEMVGMIPEAQARELARLLK